MKHYLIVFFAIGMLSCSLKAQQSKWIIGSGQQDSSGNWNLLTSNNLKFFELDFSNASPTGTPRTIGNSIKNIVSYGTSDPGNSYFDKFGNNLFYVFCAAKTRANGNFLTAPSDTFYIAEYDTVTQADEVTAKFATAKFGASVLDMELVQRGCQKSVDGMATKNEHSYCKFVKD